MSLSEGWAYGERWPDAPDGFLVLTVIFTIFLLKERTAKATESTSGMDVDADDNVDEESALERERRKRQEMDRQAEELISVREMDTSDLSHSAHR